MDPKDVGAEASWRPQGRLRGSSGKMAKLGSAEQSRELSALLVIFKTFQGLLSTHFFPVKCLGLLACPLSGMQGKHGKSGAGGRAALYV